MLENDLNAIFAKVDGEAGNSGQTPPNGNAYGWGNGNGNGGNNGGGNGGGYNGGGGTGGNNGGGTTGTSSNGTNVEKFVFYYHPDHLGSSSYITDVNGEVSQHIEYFAFGETFVEEHSNTGATPYKFNAKELDDETGLYYYGARYFDPKTSVWASVDPLAEKFAGRSPYEYCFSSPINLIDPTGMGPTGDIYTKSGKYLGWDGKNDQKVYVVDDGKVVKNSQGVSKWAVKDQIELKGVKHDVFLGFASLVHAESEGSKEESYAIANVTMNFINGGGSSQLKTLNDVAMYDNKFAQGATQKYFSDFTAKSFEGERNSKFALGAVINALGYSQGLAGYSDYSNGATGWDGIDLVDSSWKNNHRSYIWSTDSKSLLSKYKTDNNGGVNVSGFKYKSTGYEIEATKIIGKTIYEKITTGRGEKKQSNVRFKY